VLVDDAVIFWLAIGRTVVAAPGSEEQMGAKFNLAEGLVDGNKFYPKNCFRFSNDTNLSLRPCVLNSVCELYAEIFREG
jgi:hypothetical protein